jgi:hypothetical protein
MIGYNTLPLRHGAVKVTSDDHNRGQLTRVSH